MKELFLNIDLLNYRPSIFFNQKDTVNSFPGAILTIIAAIATFILSIFFLRECTDREKYTLSSSDTFNGNNNHTLNYFDFAWSVRSGLGDEFPDFLRLVNFEFSQITFRRYYNKLKGRSDLDAFLLPEDMRKCNVADLDPTGSTNSSLPVNQGYWCLPEGLIHNYYRYGSSSDRLYFIFFPCQNKTLPDGSIQEPACFPSDVIQKTLQQNELYLFLHLRNIQINHDALKGHENIFKPYLMKFTFKFSLDIYLRYLLHIQPVRYDLDIGYIFEDVTPYSSYNYLKYEMQVDTVKKVIEGKFNKHLNKFAMFDLVLADELRHYKRNYVKLQTVAANVGGIAEFFIMICQVLLYYYSKQLYIAELGNSIYSLNKETKLDYFQKINLIDGKNVIKNNNDKSNLCNQNNYPNNSVSIFNNFKFKRNLNESSKINLASINNHSEKEDNYINKKSNELNELNNAKILVQSSINNVNYNNSNEIHDNQVNDINSGPKSINSLLSSFPARKLAVNNTNFLYYTKIQETNEFYFKLKELKDERIGMFDKSGQIPFKFEAGFLDKFGLESRQFKALKNELNKILSIERIINNITELVHFKNYFEEMNDLVYLGNGIAFNKINESFDSNFQSGSSLDKIENIINNNSASVYINKK